MLSKSQYIRALQCHKSLWLHKNKPEFKNSSLEEESLFTTGLTVGDYAKQLFPGGIEVEFTSNDFASMIKKTSDLIKQGVDVIYEAAFKENGVFAMADILCREDDAWNIYEVKSSTEIKGTYIEDASVQYYALSEVIKINKVFIVHIDNEYVRQGDIKIHELFSINEITDQVLDKQSEIKSNISNIESMLKKDVPDIDIGLHCSKPYDCDFSEHCWNHIPSPSIFNLYRLNKTKKFDLYNKGITGFEDIPTDYKLSNVQQVQVSSSLSKQVIVEQDTIKNFLSAVEFPISFFDFETFQNAIPRFDNQRPYMQMPFQYSLHIMNSNGDMQHKEFLGDENQDPRRILAERMLNDIPKTGSIMAYNMSFEIMCIKGLAELYPDLRNQLMELTTRFVDLIVPFRQLGFYHPDFNGSFSIKSVLPAMFPNVTELDYKKLGIQNGGMAMDTFANLHLLKDRVRRDEIRSDLLAYCHLDTLAMVRIFEKLQFIVI